MSKIVTKYQMTGECKISVKEVMKVWDKNWNISQWRDDYTLCCDDPTADNFTKTSMKVSISKRQAHELIGKLDLVDVQSSVFRSGRTWRSKNTDNK